MRRIEEQRLRLELWDIGVPGPFEERARARAGRELGEGKRALLGGSVQPCQRGLLGH